MTRQSTLRRSLAVPPVAAGSDGDGSHGMMTRARRRRLSLLAQWRDWANLLPVDLVEEISGRLLSLDVAEYLRFRAVCSPWRGLTADPRTAGLLHSRFRPRNWMVLSIIPDAEPHRRLLNLATAASLGVDPPALSSHCHICDVYGLLLLYHKPTTTIRLLDPLTSALTEFPAISSIVPAVPLDHHTVLFKNPLGTIPRAINGAAFDDSTSPPTLLLCLRGGLATIIFAKPGDAHWTMVTPGRSTHPRNYQHQQLLFFTLLSLGGHCYISSPEGSLYLMELQPLPRLVEVVDQHRFADPDNIWRERIMSFLVSGTAGRMLMVRYWSGMVERFGGVEAYNPEELFTARGITSRIEVLEVDIAGRRLVPVRSLGRYAVFIGLRHCLHISTETFPSISADTIYLGCHHQQFRGFGIYHINNTKNHPRTEHNDKFVFDISRLYSELWH
ncbi:hypothetical protein VPH35_106382 [Triticum aestivum]